MIMMIMIVVVMMTMIMIILMKMKIMIVVVVMMVMIEKKKMMMVTEMMLMMLYELMDIAWDDMISSIMIHCNRRLLEESRLNRMRLEAAKASSAAVLRQQVFYFDPMYGDVPSNLITAAGAVPDVMSIASLNNTNSNAYAQDDNISIGNNSLSGMTSTSGSAKYSTGKNVGILNRGLGIDNNSNKPQKYHIVNNTQTLQGQLQGINIAAVQHHNNGSTHGASQHTQEELLRQLFPSWF